MNNKQRMIYTGERRNFYFPLKTEQQKQDSGQEDEFNASDLGSAISQHCNSGQCPVKTINTSVVYT